MMLIMRDESHIRHRKAVLQTSEHAAILFISTTILMSPTNVTVIGYNDLSNRGEINTPPIMKICFEYDLVLFSIFELVSLQLMFVSSTTALI